jgi:hypothetical protein
MLYQRALLSKEVQQIFRESTTRRNAFRADVVASSNVREAYDRVHGDETNDSDDVGDDGECFDECLW